MSLEDDLSKRKWPAPPFEIRPPSEGKPSEKEVMLSSAISEYDRSAYVREGRIVMRQLGWKGVVKPIPPGESAVTSLVVDPKGRVVGATSGQRSHLFIYDPEVDRVTDLCAFDEDSVAKNSVVACRDGTVIAATRKGTGGRGPSRLVSFRTDYKETLTWGPSKPTLESLDLPKKEEGIACLIYDAVRSTAYGITSITGTFFTLDIESGSYKLIGPVDELGEFSDCLAIGCDGHVYGGKRWGQLFEFDPEKGSIRQLGLSIPSLAGRQLYNKVDAIALDRSSGKMYGGGTADGVLFSFDPVAGQVISLGKPTSQPRTRAITVGRDGRVYGISGRVGGAAHLFRYDPASGDLRDLGIPLAYSDQEWCGYEFDCMITGSSGEIYMGESDRIGHLFIYYPAIGQ
jgi:hypothetical protein